jgi:hypothetical protein
MRTLPALLVIAAHMAAPAAAQNLTGLCLDLREEGCMPRHLPFDGNTIDFCEETCRLTGPVPVRGMDATLYDLQCRGDYGAIPDKRVMILRQQDYALGPQSSWVDPNSTYPIVRCP